MLRLHWPIISSKRRKYCDGITPTLRLIYTLIQFRIKLLHFVNNYEKTVVVQNKSNFLLKNQWKGINCKQSTRWLHLSRLKASALFSLQFILAVMKHSNLYLGLVLPSGGWQSLIVQPVIITIILNKNALI